MYAHWQCQYRSPYSVYQAGWGEAAVVSMLLDAVLHWRENGRKKTKQPTEGSHSPPSVTKRFSLPDTLTNHLSVNLIVCMPVCLLNCLPACLCLSSAQPPHPLSRSLSLATEPDNHGAAVSGCHSEVAVETSGAKLESFLRASGVTQP